MSESDSEEEVKVAPKSKYEESKWIRQAKSTITNESMKFDIEQEESDLSSWGWSSTLYSREGAGEAWLEDFKFKYIIG